MSWITVVDNEYVTMKVSPEKDMIYHTFHQPIAGKVFRDYLNTGVETMKQYGITKWLSDDRKNVAIPEEDVEWSTSDWGVRALAAGWKYWAIVVPEDYAGRETMADLRKHYHEKGLELQVFVTPEQAMEWLETAHLEDDPD
ncbi:MAG: hypothetical protein L0154_17890 [Chloroflexi bacterium]|nr:hypothetical protein [Chloroflexota bacterium]